ncbi:MAG: hypothetical protein Q4G23_07320 [Clostridia bacterium]|nr:hypothetical protein [Clostridia bacterium]
MSKKRKDGKVINNVSEEKVAEKVTGQDNVAEELQVIDEKTPSEAEMKFEISPENLKRIIIGIIALLVALFVVVSLLPGKEDKILKLIKGEQYEVAMEYAEKKKISGLTGDDEKTHEIELTLLYKYRELSKTVISGEDSYETGKTAYELGRKLFPDNIEKNLEAVALKESLDMIDEIKAVDELLDSGSYTEAFNMIATSAFKNEEYYYEAVKGFVSVLEKDAVAEELEAGLEKLVDSEGFVTAPAFMKAETDLLAECVDENQTAHYKKIIDDANAEKTCIAQKCKNIKVTGALYCTVHKCKNSSCNNYFQNGYCSIHDCNALECRGAAVEGGAYCPVHTCKEENCVYYAENDYCYSHTCAKYGCTNGRIQEGNYCSEHTCKEEECKLYAEENYCFLHECLAQGCKNKKASDNLYCKTHQ